MSKIGLCTRQIHALRLAARQDVFAEHVFFPGVGFAGLTYMYMIV